MHKNRFFVTPLIILLLASSYLFSATLVPGNYANAAPAVLYAAPLAQGTGDCLRGQPAQVKLLTETDTARLPSAVQRYLVFTGAMGKPHVWNYRLRFSGALRNGPDDRWMPMTAYQQSFTNPPARLFLVESSMFGVPFKAFHRYVGSEATFKVKLASLLTVVDAHGAEMKRSETVTLLNDMFLLAPATLIDPNLSWERN